jgi:hypothetical protein
VSVDCLDEAVRDYPDLWRKKAAEEGRERRSRPERKLAGAADPVAAGSDMPGRSLLRRFVDRAAPSDQSLARHIERKSLSGIAP